MKQQVPGSLLPSGSLLPFQGLPKVSNDDSFSSALDDGGTNAWQQCLHMHEEVLQAVREEQKLLNDWFDRIQSEYTGQAEKQSKQLEAIAEKQAAKQEELMRHVGEHLQEQIIAELFTRQQSPNHVSSAQPLTWPDSQVQPGTPQRQLSKDEGASYLHREQEEGTSGDKKHWSVGCENARLQYLRDGSLEEYIRRGLEEFSDSASTEDAIGSEHVDWHQQVLYKKMESIGWLHRVLMDRGLVDSTSTVSPENMLAQVVHSDWFTAVLSILILLNTVAIGVEAHVSVTHLLAFPPKEIPIIFGILDWTFIVIFFIELVLRMAADRWWFFIGSERRWHMLDVLLVLTSILAKLLQGNAVLSVRTFRVFRSVRVLRVIRVLRFFRDLRMMVLAIGAALWSLTWAFALLLLIMFVFAITIMQSIAYYLKDSRPDDSSVNALLLWYGSLPVTMFSLMQAISGGADWGTIVEPLVQVSSWWKIIFSIYIVFVVFGVLNILTGVFVTTASEIMDRDLIVHFEEQRAETFIKDMKALFGEFDVDKKGTVNWKTFKEYMKNIKVQAYLAAVGLDCSDAFTLFRLMDKDESKSVDIMKFILGCVRLRGQAKSVDLMILSKNFESQDNAVKKMQGALRSIRFEISVVLRALGAFEHTQQV